MIQPLTKLRLLTLAAKYRVEMLHHSDGHIIIRINNWHLIKDKIADILALAENDPAIHSIQIENQLVDILYDPHVLNDTDILMRGLAVIEGFNLLFFWGWVLGVGVKCGMGARL